MSRRFPLLFATAALLASAGAWAGVDRWTTAGPFGGRVDSAALSPAAPTLIYAASHRTVYRGLNAGESWVEAGAGLYGAELGELRIAADPARSGRLLAAGGRSVFLTRDGGRNWQRSDLSLPLSSSFGTTDVAIAPSQPSRIYLATREGLYRSDDGGAQWGQTGTSVPGRLQRVAVAPNDPQLVLVWSDQHDIVNFPASLYRSINGGASFQPVNAAWDDLGPIEEELDLLAFNGNVPGTVFLAGEFGNFRSLDGGATFQRLPDLPLGPNQRLQGMDWAPGEPGRLVFGTSRGVLGSSDNGNSFIPLNSGLDVGGPLPASIGSILLRPDEPQQVIAFSRSGDVFRSVDAGGEWLASSSGLVGTRVASVAVHPQAPSIVFAGIENELSDALSPALYQSIDLAATWLRRNNALALDSVSRIAFDPRSPALASDAVVFALGEDFAPQGLPETSYQGGISVSTNGGIDWQRADNLDPAPTWGPAALGQVHDIAFAQGDPLAGRTSHLFFAADGRVACPPGGPVLQVPRLWASADEAASWQPRDGLPNGVCRPDLGALYPVPVTLQWYERNDVTYLFAGTALPGFCEICADGDLGVPNGVFLSTDGGATWQPRSTGLPTLPDGVVYDVVALARNAIWGDLYAALSPPGDAPGTAHIYRSFDNGLTWTPYEEDLSGERVRALHFDEPGGGRLFAAMDGSPTNPGGVFVRAESAPGWTSINIGLPPDSARSLAISNTVPGPATLHVGTDQGVWSLTKFPDSDADGPSNTDEDTSPNGGDGNSDGVPDRNQADVASIVNYPGDGQAGKAAEGAAKRATIGNINLRVVKGGAPCTQVLDVHQPSLDSLREDAGFQYPAGVFRFEFEACTQATVELILHDDAIPSAASFRRFGPEVVGDPLSIGWKPMNATRLGNTWRLELSDNESGDLRSDSGRFLFIGGPAVDFEIFSDGFESF